MHTQDITFYRKMYYLKHKQHLLQYRKQRYETKKDMINVKIQCPHCERYVIQRMYKKHLETNIHKKGKKRSVSKPQTNVSQSRNGWLEFK